MGQDLCCSCIEIRRGVWILAILGLIGAIASIGNGCIETGRTLRDNVNRKESQGSLRVQIMAYVLEILLDTANLALCIFLMVGLSKRHPRKLQVWVNINFGLLALTIGALIGVAVWLLIVTPASIGFPMAVSIAIVGGLVSALRAYFIFVVRRYGSIMEQENAVKVPVPYC